LENVRKWHIYPHNRPIAGVLLELDGWEVFNFDRFAAVIRSETVPKTVSEPKKSLFRTLPCHLIR
jgi:hypothetical protein